jgi:hypothetical protein
MQPSNDSSFNYSPQPSYQVPTMPRQRPTGVTVLAILKLLSVVLAVLVIWLGQREIERVQAQWAAAPAIGQPGATDDLVVGLRGILDDTYQSRISNLRIAQVFSGLDIPLGLLVGWGLWTMRRWARAWTIGIAWVSIGLSVAGMCLAGQVNIPLGIALNGVVIWYLMRENVKDAFDPGVFDST